MSNLSSTTVIRFHLANSVSFHATLAFRAHKLQRCLTIGPIAATGTAKNRSYSGAATGTAGQTRGVPTGGVSDDAGLGDYNVVFTGDLSACALSATVTGIAPGIVTVTPTVAADKATTAVDVRTFDGAGAPADHPFHLVANC